MHPMPLDDNYSPLSPSVLNTAVAPKVKRERRRNWDEEEEEEDKEGWVGGCVEWLIKLLVKKKRLVAQKIVNQVDNQKKKEGKFDHLQTM